MTHLTLDPELVSGLDIRRRLVRPTLTRIRHHIIVVLIFHRPDTFPVEPGEKVVPRLEPVVLLVGLTLVELFKRVLGALGSVGNVL